MLSPRTTSVDMKQITHDKYSLIIVDYGSPSTIIIVDEISFKEIIYNYFKYIKDNGKLEITRHKKTNYIPEKNYIIKCELLILFQLQYLEFQSTDIVLVKKWNGIIIIKKIMDFLLGYQLLLE